MSDDESVLYMATEQTPKMTRQPVHALMRCCFGAMWFVMANAVGTTRYGAHEAVRLVSYVSGDHKLVDPRRLNSSRKSTPCTAAAAAARSVLGDSS